MKFIWEIDDVKGGVQAQSQHNQYRVLVIVENNLGGADRFGLVHLTGGHVIKRAVHQREIAKELTDGSFAPVQPEDGDKDDQ